VIDGEDGDNNDKAVVAAAILTINNIKNYKFIRCLARKGSGGEKRLLQKEGKWERERKGAPEVDLVSFVGGASKRASSRSRRQQSTYEIHDRCLL
jgi:hypothetical protein